jgi:hypothetical protein
MPGPRCRIGVLMFTSQSRADDSRPDDSAIHHALLREQCCIVSEAAAKLRLLGPTDGSNTDETSHAGSTTGRFSAPGAGSHGGGDCVAATNLLRTWTRDALLARSMDTTERRLSAAFTALR